MKYVIFFYNPDTSYKGSFSVRGKKNLTKELHGLMNNGLIIDDVCRVIKGQFITLF